MFMLLAQVPAIKRGLKLADREKGHKSFSDMISSHRNKPRQEDPFVTLGNLAREKYQKFKDKGVPLENAHIADVQREGAQFKEDRAAALGRNSAIQALGPISTTTQINPGQMVRALDRRRSVLGDSTSQAANQGAQTQQTSALKKKVGLVQLGRGIQSKGSNLMVNSTAMDFGRMMAERNAAAAAKGARQGAIGTIAGAAATAGFNKYGDSQGWWD